MDERVNRILDELNAVLERADEAGLLLSKSLEAEATDGKTWAGRLVFTVGRCRKRAAAAEKREQ